MPTISHLETKQNILSLFPSGAPTEVLSREEKYPFFLISTMLMMKDNAGAEASQAQSSEQLASEKR